MPSPSDNSINPDYGINKEPDFSDELDEGLQVALANEEKQTPPISPEFSKASKKSLLSVFEQYAIKPIAVWSYRAQNYVWDKIKSCAQKPVRNFAYASVFGFAGISITQGTYETCNQIEQGEFNPANPYDAVLIFPAEWMRNTAFHFGSNTRIIRDGIMDGWHCFDGAEENISIEVFKWPSPGKNEEYDPEEGPYLPPLLPAPLMPDFNGESMPPLLLPPFPEQESPFIDEPRPEPLISV